MIDANAVTTPVDDRYLTRIRTQSPQSWGATVSEKILPLQADGAQPGVRFEGQAVIARFHRSVVADVRATAHRVLRNRQIVSNDKLRVCKIVWQLGGRTLLEQKRGVVDIRPGQWAIYDASQPYTFEVCDGAHFLVLLVPMDEFADWSADIDRIAGKPLIAQGTTEVARAALAGVLSGGVGLEDEGQRILQQSVLALMGSAIRMVEASSKDELRGVHRKLQAAQAYIDENLTEPVLSPDRVAQACGMSRRSLYDAFNQLADTPHAYIQKRRLARACEMLAAPDGRHTITQIAYELGFADAAHFSRLFSEHQGCSPSQWRKRRFAGH